jgi:ATP-dependent DNA ligase
MLAISSANFRVVKVFDLLFLNGQSLLHRSTNFRKKNMRACLKEIQGRIEYAIEYKGKTAKDIRERMDEVMAARGEGLVIKHPLSKYVLNGRNMDWIKVCTSHPHCSIVYNPCLLGQARVHGRKPHPPLE